MKEEQIQIDTKNNFTEALVWGIVSGFVIAIAPWFALEVFTRHISLDVLRTGDFSLLRAEYSFAALIAFPLVQGFVAALKLYRSEVSFGKAFGISLLIFLFDVAASMFLLREGVLCIIIASPIIVTLVLIGFGLGRVFRNRFVKDKINAHIWPLLAVLAFSSNFIQESNKENAISDTVTINAPPEYVWKYIVEHPVNLRQADYWLWQIGMPMPIQSTAPIIGVGQRRDCKFTGNLAFEEEITELVPNKVLTFKVTKQPQDPEIIGHFDLVKGQMYLEKNADNSTSIIATSWYKVRVPPVSYFDWWATDITRHVHFRVLTHIKALAEADFNSNRMALPPI